MKYLQPRATYVANHRLLEAVEAAIAPVPSPTTDKLKTMLEQRYPEFVRQLQSQAADPKLLAVIKAGMYDGDREDERIVFPDKPTAHYVRDLIPMQNEIDVDGSLRFQLSTTPEKNFGLDKIVAGEPITIVAPLVILNGKYVLDGHHRWSQTYAMNKDGQIVCFNFTTKASDIDPQQVLKAMQMAIAAITHEVATATVKGENLLRASEQAVLDYVTEGKGSTKAEFKGASDEAVRIVGVKHADVRQGVHGQVHLEQRPRDADQQPAVRRQQRSRAGRHAADGRRDRLAGVQGPAQQGRHQLLGACRSAEGAGTSCRTGQARDRGRLGPYIKKG